MGGTFVSLTPQLRRYAHAVLGKWPAAPRPGRESASRVDQDADDLVHEALLHFWRACPGRFRSAEPVGMKGAPDGGLLLDLYRRVTALARRQPVEALDLGRPNDEEIRRREPVPHFAWAPEARALPSLTLDLRAPLALVVLERLSYRQAGIVLGMPAEQALARLIVARSRLASAISGSPRIHLVVVQSPRGDAETPVLAGNPLTEHDLHCFVDEQLDENRRDEVAAFLEAHPDATRRTAEWRRQNERLRRAFEPLLREPLPLSLDFATPDALFRLQSGQTRPRRGVFRGLVEMLSPPATQVPITPGGF